MDVVDLRFFESVFQVIKSRSLRVNDSTLA